MPRVPSALLEQLRQLPKRPTDAQLAPCIASIIEYAGVAVKPAMSAAALLRSHAQAVGISKETVGRLRSAVTEHFRAEHRRQEREARVSREHLPVKAAARVLGEEERELLAKLIDPGQRRLYGWPYWNGNTFMLPVLACGAATRAAFLDTLPPIEPSAIAETLPPWCRRAHAGDRPSAALDA